MSDQDANLMPAVVGEAQAALPPLSSLLSAASSQPAADFSAPDTDALQILLQASAAAEVLQSRFRELQQRRAEIAAEHQQLDAERRAFEQRAQEFASQVAKDRAAQRELQAELEQKLAKTTVLEEQLEQQSAELRAAQRSLSDERVLLKQALKSELDEERARLAEQRQQVDVFRRELESQRLQDQTLLADRLRQFDENLTTEKLRLEDRVRDEMASELAQINREKLEWNHVRDQQLYELQQQAEDLQQQREAFGEQIEVEQNRLRDEIEKRRQQLLTEQNNLQRRYRFQFEHLGRAREDLDLEVRDLRREQQMFRTERHRFLELHRLRSRQLELVRSRLEEIEASLHRETRIVDRSRAAALADVQRLRLRSEEEREAVSRDLENRQRRIRQQEASLAELAARLDERAQRLGRLRAELDKTQAEILEQRLSIEEARGLMLRESGPSDQTRARLEQARGDVQAFFDRMRQQLNEERDKIESAASEVSDRQIQFRKDRAELEQWFGSREAALADRTSDSVVDQQQQAILSLQQQLADLQERWLSDRRDGERTIRDLLTQLAAHEIEIAETPMPPQREAA